MITVLACTVDAGAIDTTSVDTAFWIFVIGVSVLVAHTTLFVYRSSKKKRKSSWIFWSTLGLSVLIIPVVFFLIAISAGTACGIGASNPPTFLLIFELTAFAAQMLSWKFSDQPGSSPIPQD